MVGLSNRDPRHDSRARIIQAGRQEFGDYGYAGARTARIAQRAGVNKQLLFYYFGSKAGLYQVVLEQAAGEVDGLPPADGEVDAPERVRSAVRRLFDELAAHPDLVRLVFREAQRSDGGDVVVERQVGRLLADLSQVISEGQGLGFFRDDVDPHRGAEQALILTLGYLGLAGVLPTTTRADGSAWRDAVGDWLLRGLSW